MLALRLLSVCVIIGYFIVMQIVVTDNYDSKDPSFCLSDKLFVKTTKVNDYMTENL